MAKGKDPNSKSVTCLPAGVVPDPRQEAVYIIREDEQFLLQDQFIEEQSDFGKAESYPPPNP